MDMAEKSFAPSYGFSNTTKTVAQIKEELDTGVTSEFSADGDSAVDFPRTVNAARASRVVLLEDGDISQLNTAYREQIEKIERLNPDEVLERLHLGAQRLKPVKQSGLHLRPQLASSNKVIIPPFKKNAPIVSAPAIPEIPAPAVRAKPPLLTADEILALHKRDFEQKKFKPSFIAVTSEEEEAEAKPAELVTEATEVAEVHEAAEIVEVPEIAEASAINEVFDDEVTENAIRMAKIYYSSDPEDYL